MSFISSGNMVTDQPVDPTAVDFDHWSNSTDQAPNYGAFEMHTTGFGSRMMAKMGYVDRGGLGEDGKGMAEPIEVIQRPKSLGLGAKISESSNNLEAEKNNNCNYMTCRLMDLASMEGIGISWFWYFLGPLTDKPCGLGQE